MGDRDRHTHTPISTPPRQNCHDRFLFCTGKDSTPPAHTHTPSHSRRRRGRLGRLAPLPEPVLGPAGQVLHVPHAAGAGRLAAQGLLGPVVCGGWGVGRSEKRRGRRGLRAREKGGVVDLSRASPAAAAFSAPAFVRFARRLLGQRARACNIPRAHPPPRSLVFFGPSSEKKGKKMTHICGGGRPGSRTQRTSTSGCGRSGGRTDGTGCASCCGAYLGGEIVGEGGGE